MKTLSSADDIHAAKGQELGVSDWMTIEQERIDQFAEATGDFQWIHVDAERAKDGPFGATIAHGYLTLSLLPLLTNQIYSIDGARMRVNYGLNKVRFPSPVKVGARVRARSEIIDVTDVADGLQVVLRTAIEVEGAERPACVAEHVGRVYF
jgi:acyl dehydratase